MKRKIVKVKLTTINKKKSLFLTLYSTILIIAPILSIYGIGISTITFFDFLLILLNVLMILDLLVTNKAKIPLKKLVAFNFVPYYIYIFITMIVHINDNEVLLRTLRYLLYLSNIVFFVKTYFNYSIAVRVYKRVAWIATIFLFIQVTFSKILGIYIPGILTNLPLVVEDLYNYDKTFQMAQVKRVMSFFAEPSHFAIFILGYFVILLFSHNIKNTKKSNFFFESIFLSIGIILSTSILGVIVMTFMWSLWLVCNFKKFFLKPYMLLFLPLIFLILYYLLIDTTALQYITNPSVFQRQFEGRFEGYHFLSSINQSLGEKIFGHGMTKIDMNVYLPSYPILIFYFGYTGFILYMAAFLSYIFKPRNNVTTAILICMLIISLASEILVGNFIVIYFSLIISSSKCRDSLLR